MKLEKHLGRLWVEKNPNPLSISKNRSKSGYLHSFEWEEGSFVDSLSRKRDGTPPANLDHVNSQ